MEAPKLVNGFPKKRNGIPNNFQAIFGEVPRMFYEDEGSNCIYKVAIGQKTYFYSCSGGSFRKCNLEK